VSRDFEVGTVRVRPLRRVDRQSCTGLIYYNCNLCTSSTYFYCCVIVPLPFFGVGESVMYSRFVAYISTVCPRRSCYHDMSWSAWTVSMKLTVNIHWPLRMNW